MKKILLSVLLLVPVILISQTQVPPGPVSGTWDQDGSPYMVNGDLYIEESETLTIERGVDVKVQQLELIRLILLFLHG